MELEVKDQEPRDRQKYSTRVKSYKSELSKLQKDMVSFFKGVRQGFGFNPDPGNNN